MLAPKPISRAQKRSEKKARQQRFGGNVILELPSGSPSNGMLGHKTGWIEVALDAGLDHVPDSEVVPVRIAAQEEPRRRKSDDRDDHRDNTGTRMFILRSPPVVRQKDADWIPRWIASVNPFMA
jgi:hypothetical protein